jgi:hypothetical protein
MLTTACTEDELLSISPDLRGGNVLIAGAGAGTRTGTGAGDELVLLDAD